MRTGLLEAIVHGDRQVWALFGVLWLATTVLVLLQRTDARARVGRLLAIASLASATSLAGLSLATALALPRIVFRTVDEPALAAPSGESWHKLRGPAVVAIVDGAPDIAVPTIDAQGRWVLYGLLAGRPVPSLPPAPANPPDNGGLRLCSFDRDPCRAWPASWPDPARTPAFGDLAWSRGGAADALAYDAETGEFLRGTSSGRDGPALDLVGRMNGDTPREGTSALFMVRRVHHGRFDAVRVVSTQTPAGQRFLVQRAGVSLGLAPRLLRIAARPVLLVAALALPWVALAYAFAPALFAAILRRRGAARRELDQDLVLMPVHGATDASAVVEEQATLGDVVLGRGTVVALAVSDGARIASRTWLELPTRGTAPEEPASAARPDAANEPSRGAAKVGALVPADAAPFARIARAWACRRAMAVAVLAAGVAAAVPGVMAIVGLFAGR